MRPRIPAAGWIAVLFVLLGFPFLRRAGLHFDASYELACFYPCSIAVFKSALFGYSLPWMVIQYLGAFKAWLFLPILHWLEVNALVLRLPMLFVGGGSVWLFHAILERAAGRRAATAGALLLATDASFVIATGYDFGPIALLHFFLMAGILLLLRFEETGKSRFLALAFFLFGLALWHKAMFIFMLAGLVAAALAVFPKRILVLASAARIAVAAGSLALGALPLLYFNVATGGATLNAAGVMSARTPFRAKALLLKRTLDGSALFGFLTEERQPKTAVPAARLPGKIAVGVSRLAGGPRSDWMIYGLLAACCLLPWLWPTRARALAVFALLYMAVTWGLIAMVPNAGATLHHAILIWPFPHFLVAVAGAQLSYKLGKRGVRVMGAALAALVVCNLLVVNEYYAQLVTKGTTAVWTDAIDPLFEYLDALPPNTRVVTTDWGYAATLCLLSDGQMALQDISYVLLKPSEAEAAYIGKLMADPHAVFVNHAAGGEQFAGTGARVARIAAMAGLHPEVVKVIQDRNFRPRFEVVRYTAANAGPANR